MALMGFISSAILDSDVVKDGHHQNLANVPKCLTMRYKHHDLEVHRKTFLVCMALGHIAFEMLLKEHEKYK